MYGSHVVEIHCTNFSVKITSTNIDISSKIFVAPISDKESLWLPTTSNKGQHGSNGIQ